MAIQVSGVINQSFNDCYPRRPVWALASNGLALGNSPIVAMFDGLSPYVPMNVEGPGSAKSKSRTFQDAMAIAGYGFFGNATAPAAAVWSPTTGCYGITVNTQTGCLNNFDASDNGNYGYYQAVTSQADQLAAVSGIVVGESNWRQCYELVLTNSGLIYKEEIGSGLGTVTGGNRPFINVNTLTGFTTAGATNWGYGQISHNRNTGHLLIVQPNGGVNGVSLTFRLHVLNLQNKIGRSTTIAQIQAWMATALAAPGTLYGYHDVVFSNTRCFYSATIATSYDALDSEFVLCNNDEVWMFKSSDMSNTALTCPNALFAANLTGTFASGTYAATMVTGFTNSAAQFGHANAPMYGARHMNSDDNTVVALYQHNYNYTGGFNIAMVSTANAGATAFNYTSNYSAATYTIAPTGLANFILCNSSANNVASGATMGFLDNQILAATAITWSSLTCIWPTFESASVCYGANMVLKVQPTTEWQ